jgi:hypothetical protein
VVALVVGVGQRLEVALRRVLVDEEAPQPVGEMASRRGVRTDELDHVLHLQNADMPEKRHLPLVGAVGNELALAVLLDPAGERQRPLTHVVLAVVIVPPRVLNAHREEFH